MYSTCSLFRCLFLAILAIAGARGVFEPPPDDAHPAARPSIRLGRPAPGPVSLFNDAAQQSAAICPRRSTLKSTDELGYDLPLGAGISPITVELAGADLVTDAATAVAGRGSGGSARIAATRGPPTVS